MMVSAYTLSYGSKTIQTWDGHPSTTDRGICKRIYLP
jgi:hypothetical protein